MPLLSLIFLATAGGLFWIGGVMSGQRRQYWAIWQIASTAGSFAVLASIVAQPIYPHGVFVLQSLVMSVTIFTLYRVFGPQLRGHFRRLR